MVVNVWDGITPGMGWAPFSGTLGFPDGTIDPDVTLVRRNSQNQVGSPLTWFAIVVYSDYNLDCWCAIYEWDLTNTTFLTYNPVVTQLINSHSLYAQYSTAINVDADESGNFVITWDDFYDQNPAHYHWDIQVIGGQANSSSLFSGTCPTAYTIPISAGGINDDRYISPDVTLFPDYNNSTSAVHLTFTHLQGVPIELYVQSCDFINDIINGNLSFSTDLTEYLDPGDYFFSRPRISCPTNYSSALTTDWSVAVSVYCSGTSAAYSLTSGINIINYTNYNTSAYRHNYTDGSNPPCALGGNFDPVVCYDPDYQGMMVGWDSDFYDESGAFIPRSCLAVVCDLTGDIITSCYDNGNAGYMIVPSDHGTHVNSQYDHQYQVHLSICGRDNPANNIFTMKYSFYDFAYELDHATQTTVITVYEDDVPYKGVEFCNNNKSLRMKDETLSNFTIGLSPNPFTSELNIFSNINEKDILYFNIFNISGEKVFEATGNLGKINEMLNPKISTIPSGMYIVETKYENWIDREKLIKY